MKRFISLFIASIMTFSLIGCGTTSTTPSDNNTNNSGEKKETQKVAQGVTDTEILIGNCAATSGAFGPVGTPYIKAMEAYTLMVNEKGGINGRKIKFIHQDDEMNPEKGKAAYDKLINDDKVFAIVGAFGTPVVGAILEDLKDAGIPSVYFATGMAALFNEKAEGRDRVIYPVQPIYTTEGLVFTAWAKGTFKGNKIGIIYSGDDAGKGIYAGVKKGAEEKGMEVVAEQVAYGAEDVSAAVTKVLASNPDVVIIGSMQNTFLTVAKELGKQGNTKPTLTSYVNAGPTYYSQFAADIKGKYELYAPGWVDMTVPDEDVKNMQTYLAKVTNEDYSLSAYAMSGWIAMKFFVTGVERVGTDTLSWENYMNALEKEPIELGFGSGSLIDYSNGKRYGTQKLALYRFDMDAVGTVEKFKDFLTIDEILAGK